MQIWNKEQALKTLKVTEIPFGDELLEDIGMSMEKALTTFYGYSPVRDAYGPMKFAVSPRAPFPESTVFHELSHSLLGHTKMKNVTPKQTCIGEMEAPFVSALCCYYLGNDKAAESQMELVLIELVKWAFNKEKEMPTKFFERTFKVAKRILEAGGVEYEEETFTQAFKKTEKYLFKGTGAGKSRENKAG